MYNYQFHCLEIRFRGSSRQPPWFIASTSVVHRVNFRGSPCQLPWFIVSTSVVHRVNLRGSSCQPPWFIVSTTRIQTISIDRLYIKKRPHGGYPARTQNSKKAATYSPAFKRSTIGAGGLNCSVRNGKRWNTAAITT